MTVILPGASRYAGFVFLLFLSCAWFAIAPPGAEAASSTAPDWRRPGIGVVLALVLVAQIIATVAIYPAATRTAFSRDEALAQAVHVAHLDDAIVSGADTDGTTIGAYLDRSVYSVARHRWIRYLIHDQREASGYRRLTDRDVRCAAETHREQPGTTRGGGHRPSDARAATHRPEWARSCLPGRPSAATCAAMRRDPVTALVVRMSPIAFYQRTFRRTG